MACDETTLGAKGSEIHSRDVFAAARNGDDLSNKLIDEEAEILGRGFTSLIHIFHQILSSWAVVCPTNLSGSNPNSTVHQ